MGLLFIVLWIIYARRNKAAQAKLNSGQVHLEDDIGKDLTDRENPHFRYTI